jgi:hypothetical protein
VAAIDEPFQILVVVGRPLADSQDPDPVLGRAHGINDPPGIQPNPPELDRARDIQAFNIQVLAGRRPRLVSQRIDDLLDPLANVRGKGFAGFVDFRLEIDPRPCHSLEGFSCHSPPT